MAVPAVAAADGPSSDAKVVIIVGADTPQYLDDADQLYAEAIQHTANVIKVYSPNATWAAVKEATTGANVVIYLGHGNGWPSPYTYDPNYTTKDGFGLNATAAGTHYNLKYYGEPYIRELALAPGAIVFFHHLCYASGNSEPGAAGPTLSVAKQRVDNYGSAFLAAGASAVIADGHSHAGYYLHALFTTDESLGDLWRGAPNYHGHQIPFTPTRSTGLGVLDPDTGGASPAGFYRSIVGNLDFTTTKVVGVKGPPGVVGEPGVTVAPGRAGDPTQATAMPRSVQSGTLVSRYRGPRITVSTATLRRSTAPATLK
jgi:hypothetical protein